MSSSHTDDKFEEYNYEADKYVSGSGHSGKGRTKKEAEQHTNWTDPGGHTRKTTQKLVNSHEKEKEERKGATTEKDSKQHCKYEPYIYMLIKYLLCRLLTLLK